MIGLIGLLVACTSPKPPADAADTAGSGDSGDTGDSGDSGGAGDTSDSDDSADTGDSGDTHDTAPVDTAPTGPDTTFWQAASSDGRTLQAVLTRTPRDDGGWTFTGTTRFDYTAAIAYTATLTETIELGPDGALERADVANVTTLGTTELRRRSIVDVATHTVRETRPAGYTEWTWSTEGSPVTWNARSDDGLGYTQSTPVAMQAVITTAAHHDTLAWVSHEFLHVYDGIAGGEAEGYAFGDRFFAEDRALVGAWIYDLDAAMIEVEGPLDLVAVDVPEGTDPVPFPDCTLPGTSEPFTVTSADGVDIAGELDRPDASSLVTGDVVVFNADFGGSDREAESGGVSRWRCLARPLLDAGIAVLRYDDRAHGESGGALDRMTWTGRTGDVVAVAEWARAQPDTRSLVLLGIGEGVAHASEAAAGVPVDGIIALAGQGTATGAELWVEQPRTYLAGLGFPEETVQGAVDGRQGVVDEIVGGTWPYATLDYLPTAFWEDFLTADGPGLAVASGAPFLVAQGEWDWEVPYANGERLRDALLDAGRDVTWVDVPGVGHAFVPAPADVPPIGDEAFLPFDWDPTLVTTIVDWVRDRQGP